MWKKIQVSWSHSRHTTFGRTPLDEWSARRRDLYLTTEKQKSMFPMGFETAVPANEGSQIHALHRAASGIGRTASNTPKLKKGVWGGDGII